MNSYIGIYKGKQYETHAKTMYCAQQQLQKQIQATTRCKVKGYDITIILSEYNGS